MLALILALFLTATGASNVDMPPVSIPTSDGWALVECEDTTAQPCVMMDDTIAADGTLVTVASVYGVNGGDMVAPFCVDDSASLCVNPVRRGDGRWVFYTD